MAKKLKANKWKYNYKITPKEEKIPSILLVYVVSAAIIAEKKVIFYAIVALIRTVISLPNIIDSKGLHARSRSPTPSKNGHKTVNRSASISSDQDRSRTKRKKAKKDK